MFCVVGFCLPRMAFPSKFHDWRCHHGAHYRPRKRRPYRLPQTSLQPSTRNQKADPGEPNLVDTGARCRLCTHLLTSEASTAAGGPVCAKKLGIDHPGGTPNWKGKRTPVNSNQLRLFDDTEQCPSRYVDESAQGVAGGLTFEPKEDMPLRDTDAAPGWTITVKVTITCHGEKAKGGGACSGY